MDLDKYGSVVPAMHINQTALARALRGVRHMSSHFLHVDLIRAHERVLLDAEACRRHPRELVSITRFPHRSAALAVRPRIRFGRRLLHLRDASQATRSPAHGRMVEKPCQHVDS
jgi:hypothetical protein